jgi:pSer/pThr/pTyr-binding forkhead associated (FHA) protein
MPSLTVKLLIVQGKPAQSDLVFSAGEYCLGRGPECQIRLNSELVSRQHCLLRITTDAAFIRDLSSRNGTLLNGTLVAGECSIVHGDHVQVGPVTFEVQFDLVAGAKETVNKQGDQTAHIEPDPPEKIEPDPENGRATRELPVAPAPAE